LEDLEDKEYINRRNKVLTEVVRQGNSRHQTKKIQSKISEETKLLMKKRKGNERRGKLHKED